MKMFVMVVVDRNRKSVVARAWPVTVSGSFKEQHTEWSMRCDQILHSAFHWSKRIKIDAEKSWKGQRTELSHIIPNHITHPLIKTPLCIVDWLKYVMHPWFMYTGCNEDLILSTNFIYPSKYYWLARFCCGERERCKLQANVWVHVAATEMLQHVCICICAFIDGHAAGEFVSL